MSADPATVPRSTKGEPAWELALLFPVQGEWTEEAYLALDTNHLVELSDGFLEVLPMPKVGHQLIVKFLLLALEAFVTPRGLGTALCAPLPVQLWKGTFREPDIVFYKPGCEFIQGQPQGADLVMEIVSEGKKNRERDFDQKRREYAKAGIAEYWIVDPENEQIFVHALKGKSYKLHGQFSAGELADSKLLLGFSISVEEVFAAGRTES